MAKKTATDKKEVKKAEMKSALIKPRITEKAAIMSESKGIYTFNVERDSNKKSIAASVKAQYKVTPEKIRIVAIPSKAVIFRGRKGVKSGGKKAYVYLKKGDKIDFA
jgi:large subunit ribosomal protein L23